MSKMTTTMAPRVSAEGTEIQGAVSHLNDTVTVTIGRVSLTLTLSEAEELLLMLDDATEAMEP